MSFVGQVAVNYAIDTASGRLAAPPTQSAGNQTLPRPYVRPGPDYGGLPVNPGGDYGYVAQTCMFEILAGR